MYVSCSCRSSETDRAMDDSECDQQTSERICRCERTQPSVLPDLFTGEGDFSEWIHHFESVADVNGWDDDVTKLRWMHVRLIGKARVALTRCKAESYKQAREALQECFEPATKKELYKRSFQSRVKELTESWGNFADNFCVLAEKAYPELQEDLRDFIALNCYLEQLRDPRISFEVRKRHPKTISEAVTVTLEVESCFLGIPDRSPCKDTEMSGQSCQFQKDSNFNVQSIAVHNVRGIDAETKEARR